MYVIDAIPLLYGCLLFALSTYFLFIIYKVMKYRKNIDEK